MGLLDSVSFVFDQPERPYHHGDLKRALIETAQQMLGEGDGWQFTLREVARRAGVSHAAPYKHFADKTALLAEIALSGYQQLRADLLAVLTQRLPSPRAEFLAIAKAYMAFAFSNPALYRLMFSSDLNENEHRELKEASRATFEVLLGILTHGQELGVFKAGPLQGQAAACWALVHGLTTLELDRQLAPDTVGERPVDAALQCLLEGIAT